MDLFKTSKLCCLLGIFLVVVDCQQRIKDKGKGALIGKLKTLSHEVSGTLWALDEDSLYIEEFNYDGRGPDAFFWMGNDSQPSPRGFIVPYPADSPTEKQNELPSFRSQNVILDLPPGQKIQNLRWFSVWCRRFTVDFGHVIIPTDLDPPKKRTLPELKRFAHGVRSGNVTILDAKTFYIPNLHYDGSAPDAFFWVGKGQQPNPQGYKVPNELGSYDPLRGYEGEDIEIQLPDNLTVYDIDYLSVWCVSYRHDFGHVLIPPASELWVPPALGQTRVKPAWWYTGTHSAPHTMVSMEFDNCLQLSESLQVQWQAKDNEIHIKLTAPIKDDQYLAFGVSSGEQPQMLNSDVVVAFYDRDSNSFRAVDYTLSARSQCDGNSGVCPDERIGGRNDASVIGGERKNGLTTVTFSRPYVTNDRLDVHIVPNQAMTVVGAIGTLNARKEANYHQEFVTRKLQKINFTSLGDNTCSPSLVPEAVPEEYKPWAPNVIRDTFNFTFTIGPTGGDRGYKAITGSPSWGIAWWGNGFLIPEIYVERGQTYYFTVEGGTSQDNPSKHHPLYITDSSSGGFGQKTSDEQKLEKIYAGVSYSQMGTPHPTAEGRYCEWIPKGGVDTWKKSETFQAYRNTLHRVCDDGEPGSLVWTVMQDTPDVVYYQCYTHSNLGWKVRVNDAGFSLKRSGCPASSSDWLSSVLLTLVAVALR